MAFHIKHRQIDDAELDITSFMNLMIVLVPVLLLSLTFTQVTVHDISLPELTGGAANSTNNQSQLEVVVSQQGFEVFYPSGTSIQAIPVLDLSDGQAMDYTQLSQVMQAVKEQLTDKRDIVVRLAGDVSYQTLVGTMDAVKSYKTTLAASVVEVELFPEISLGDSDLVNKAVKP